MHDSPVEEIRRPEVRAVGAVVGGVDVVLDPLGLVGRVVEDDVADGGHAPLDPHLAHDGLDVRPFRVEGHVQLMLIGERVGRV